MKLESPAFRHGECQKVQNKQNNGIGNRVNFDLSKKIGSIEYSVGAFWRRWSIDDSEKAILSDGVDAISFIEPLNITNEIGVNLGMHF